MQRRKRSGFTLVELLVVMAIIGILVGGDPSKSGLKGLSTTLGPLKRRLLESGPVVTSTVALLGDAAPGDIDEAILAATIGFDATDPFADGKTGSRVFFEAGELLTESFNDGPAFWDPSSNTLNLINQAANLSNQVDCECMKPCWHSKRFLDGRANLGWMA